MLLEDSSIRAKRGRVHCYPTAVLATTAESPRIAGSVARHCPFCAQVIRDDPGKDINFIVHMGLWTKEHLMRREWADYIHNLNLRAF